MAIKLVLNIEATADLLGTAAYGTAAAAVVERGTAEAGTYAAFATATLSASASQYEVWDATGTDATWYRYRISNAGGTILSDYSEPFRATALAAYATVDDLIARLNLPDETRFGLLGDILVAVSAQLDTEVGRGFYRIPQVSGTVARTYDGSGTNVLMVPEGIVSLTSVEVRDNTDSDWVTLGTAEWVLRPAYPDPGDTYRAVVLTQNSTAQVDVFPASLDTVRLTGVFGWPSVPPLVREAVIELSCRVYSESQTAYAGVVGMSEVTGTTVMPTNRPDAWHRAVRAYARRSGVAL